MSDILVDPVLLTFSTAYRTDEQKAEYLQLLNRWAEAASESEVAANWHCSDRLVYLLQSNGLFPDFHMLRQLQQAYQRVFPAGPAIDITRIQNWLERIVDEQCESEFTLGNPAVEALARAAIADAASIDIDVQKTTFQPPEFASRWHPQIYRQATDLFARLCACASLGYSYAPDLRIATKNFQPGLPLQSTTSVRIDTALYYLPVDPPAQPGIPTLPITEGEDFRHVPVFHIFPFLFSLVPEQEQQSRAWQWDGTEAGLRAAIDREYEKRYRVIVEEIRKAREQRQGGRKRTNQDNTAQALPYIYTFGSHFIRELQALSNAAARENLPLLFVEAAAAIIADQIYTGSFNLKQFRKSPGGGAPVHQRGQDKAYRIYVTTSHGGWRLNYWKGPNAEDRERIEFSVLQREGDKPRIDYD
ncbi:MAG TPA: hypothetical protein VKV40_22405 [Ktedonobacteraceae bacterium]|nr:hypothetical protein [Ktedonobacteraceae bacterium]